MLQVRVTHTGSANPTLVHRAACTTAADVLHPGEAVEFIDDRSAALFHFTCGDLGPTCSLLAAPGGSLRCLDDSWNQGKPSRLAGTLTDWLSFFFFASFVQFPCFGLSTSDVYLGNSPRRPPRLAATQQLVARGAVVAICVVSVDYFRAIGARLNTMKTL